MGGEIQNRTTISASINYRQKDWNVLYDKPFKVPDLLIGGKWYEHEGFVTDNAKRAFSNMMNHGLKQSSRIIIDKPELTDRFMLRSIINRVQHGKHIDEVWVRNNNGEIKLLYKTTDG